MHLSRGSKSMTLRLSLHKKMPASSPEQSEVALWVSSQLSSLSSITTPQFNTNSDISPIFKSTQKPHKKDVYTHWTPPTNWPDDRTHLTPSCAKLLSVKHCQKTPLWHIPETADCGYTTAKVLNSRFHLVMELVLTHSYHNQRETSRIRTLSVTYTTSAISSNMKSKSATVHSLASNCTPHVCRHFSQGYWMLTKQIHNFNAWRPRPLMHEVRVYLGVLECILLCICWVEFQ